MSSPPYLTHEMIAIFKDLIYFCAKSHNVMAKTKTIKGDNSPKRGKTQKRNLNLRTRSAYKEAFYGPRIKLTFK